MSEKPAFRKGQMNKVYIKRLKLTCCTHISTKNIIKIDRLRVTQKLSEKSEV